MSNQANSIASLVFNLHTGDVFVGRFAHNIGHVVRIEGKDGNKFVVRHKGAGHIRKVTPVHLFGAYMPVSANEGRAIWPEEIVVEPVSITLDRDSTEPAKTRQSGRRNARNAPTKLAPSTGDVSVLPGPMPATVAHEPPTPAVNDTSAAPLATTSMERVAHFGPDPLPSTPHKTVALDGGKTLRVYISQRDGTAWGVVRDLSEALRLSTVTMSKRAAALGDERAIKVDILSAYRNRAIQAWLARLDAIKSWMHPSQTEDAALDYQREQKEKAAEPALPSDGDEADGDVPDGVAIVRVDGVSLVAPGTGEADHKIRDVDLSRFIGMEPRFLRRRVKEYENKGDLNGVDWRACDARQLTNGSGVRIFQVKSAFLTMDQALFIVAKSDSPSANALTRHIISVFLKVQRQGGAVTAPVPAVDQMMATMAQIAARAASEAARETVGAMLAEFRKEQPLTASDKDIKDAETLRRQRSNAAAKGVATRDFNVVMADVRPDLVPLVARFLSDRMVRADWRDTSTIAKCLRPSELQRHFDAYLRAPSARLSPEEQTALEIIGSDQTTRNRAIYSLFNEASDHAKARKEIEEDGETRMVPVLPWYPKVSLAVDPRQTVIPGTSR